VTFEIKPYPEFAWSISRQRKLDQCPRAYFYAYYLHWNGWLDDAPAEARVAYRLGKLTSLDALLGQQVDVRARELEAAARAGAVLPEAGELETRTREALRRLWTQSRNGRAAFEARPGKVTMLRSLYLDQDTQPETDRLNEKAGPSTQGLLATSHWERLHARGDVGRVEVPDFASFSHDGIKVFAAPDLAYVADGVLHVIDWKTGRADGTQPMQVLLQMWWVLETYPALAQAAADGSLQVRGCLEYVAAGETQPVEASPGFRDQAAQTVRAGVAQMRALLADPERNIPLGKDAFERRESGLCRTCNFGPVCT
jgi:PD-(D/E)XK nuclease superfamily